MLRSFHIIVVSALSLAVGCSLQPGGGAPAHLGAAHQAVSGAGSVDVSVLSSANPSVFGQGVVISSQVVADPPSGNTPTGTVTFVDTTTSTTLGTATLTGSPPTATLPSNSNLTGGNHTVEADYSGDGNFAATVSSLDLFQQVNSSMTSINLTSSDLNNAVFGETITFTATVSAVAPGSGTPSGTIAFKVDGVTKETTALDGTGSATYATATLGFSLTGHTITAQYFGNGNFAGDTQSLTQVISKDETSTSVVTSTENPSTYGDSVTFSAVVSSVAPGSGTPTGTVTFLDGTTVIGTGTLSAGIASLTISTLTGGDHLITAAYDGDPDFQTSDSPGDIIQDVQTASTTTMVAGCRIPLSSVSP
jgi:hypothetical protein